MKNYEIKNIDGGVLDVSSPDRRVKIAISQVGGSKDLDGDVIDPNAYDRTIRERGPNAANLIWHLTDHYASLKYAVAKFSELYMDGNKLVGVSNIPNTQWGNDMLEFYKNGDINQHSIGYRTVSDQIMNPGTPDEYNLIKEVLLYEGSAVLWGANVNTPTLSVGKSLTKDELTKEFTKTIEEFEKMNLMFKKGSLSDDSYELIEMKIGQLSEKLKQLFTHLSAGKAIDENTVAGNALDSGSECLLSVLQSFNNTLKTA